jgi:hypothetical protein
LNAVQLKSSDSDLIFTYDWSNDIPDGVSLVSVVNSLPDGLAITTEQTDSTGKQSTVQINGGAHGQRYLVRALATLSEGEDVPASFIIRVWDGG